MAKTISLYCPHCKEPQASMYMCLNDTDGTFHCLECDEDVTRDEINDVIEGAKKWIAMIQWTDQMPQDSQFEEAVGV